MKLVSVFAALCLTFTGLAVSGSKAEAGGIEIRIYERHTSYRQYERVTVMARPYGIRPYGHRLHRPGYVYHNGLWFSPGSMRAGVIIDVPIPRRHIVGYGGGLNPRHYSWCADRYRSYHWRSNSFQPYYGPRAQCYSPYG
ncbi:BA14K family protein [Rhizobium sp. AG855]|uniref:BA14K family protein n=1 Tax=Rhizobium sp. AG855 TaxID=2183898 RepID=UPI000FF0D9C1|nr:BA14K family protein [Rhizobium sp. AG855]RKE85881.1 BA14K-like protein [Rhizobium sp. AG855]